MDAAPLLRIAGWSAYLSAAATILTFVTGILFFSVGQPFGTINDVSSMFQVLFMIPLAIVLYHVLPFNARTLDLIATEVGILGMIISAVGQSLLVFDRIDFQGSLKFFPAGIAIGIWLLSVCSLALASGLFPRGLAWAGLLAGAGYIVTVAGFLLGGQQNLLFYLGGLALGISYPVWAIWLGRSLLAGTLAAGTG